MHFHPSAHTFLLRGANQDNIAHERKHPAMEAYRGVELTPTLSSAVLPLPLAHCVGDLVGSRNFQESNFASPCNDAVKFHDGRNRRPYGFHFADRMYLLQHTAGEKLGWFTRVNFFIAVFSDVDESVESLFAARIRWLDTINWTGLVVGSCFKLLRRISWSNGGKLRKPSLRRIPATSTCWLWNK
jgi:hypothetical protein